MLSPAQTPRIIQRAAHRNRRTDAPTTARQRIRHAHSRVIISATRGESCVAIAIEDDGSGIANDDNLDRIFETGVHTPGGSGSGLGLALSRRLARSIGGDVHADPTNDGARLVVELPVVAHANTPTP